ncbi:isoprenoid synthase domain-containing protein [Gymnopilus junonius]|uniref:Terpene synthase n=1 Tax=Gymnopilus junonius TaxID=109634 RepID=A0A9P5NKL7_GYMJU|nr:isoprenoid synthase domain-containing protein [Gymnopilus junonius]
MSQRQYCLPDLLRDWPWIRDISPYYPKAKKESSEWVTSFHPFDTRGQRRFDACDLNLLASLTYSRRSEEFVRAGCDLMNFYFVYDEYTDVSDPKVARELANIVTNVMKNPEDEYSTKYSTNNTHLLGDMTRQFWKRATALAKPGSPCFKHFIDTSEAYLLAVTREAEDRANHTVRSVEDYLHLRRDTCGARPTLALIEFGLNLSEDVTSNPVVASLREAAVDLIILVNDMHSYTREISCGLASHNIITPIMRDYNLDLQSALEWLGTYTDGVVSKFLSNLTQVPSFDDQDLEERLWTYVDGLGQWVRGNDDWSCEGKRYYGDDGLIIKKTRLISVEPRWGNYLRLQEMASSGEETPSPALITDPIEVPAQAKEDGMSEAKDPGSGFSSPTLPLRDFVLQMEVRTWWSWIIDGVMVKSALMRLPPWKIQN